ncbi:response regulator [Xanthovirga aplysinae]|uniref:response regulator n=1 Tax=Xanthovirga aplysinae TaxID=2529853 RepID=UPI0012BB7B3F|nr:response regulator [Xanthovirga aplysinae]MTI29715.1 response regulator [Xanthovirga aplysinae]
MKKRLLIADQDFTVLKLLEFYLGKFFDVHTLKNGGEALRYLSKGKNLPDLIIINSDLLEVNGLEMVDYLRSSKRYASIPLIMISSQIRKMELDISEIYFVDDFLESPFNPVELLLKINRLLIRPSIPVLD